MNNSRRTAAFIFAAWLKTREFPQTLLPEGPDRAFIQDLVYTTIRHFRAIRFLLNPLVKKWPKGELESLLYIGAAQLFFMDSVPDFAAVSTTVEAAKACGNPAIAKVVNGVLRNAIRRREELLAALKSAPLETRESFPTVLVKRWTEAFGAEQTAALCKYHNLPAKTFLARADGTFVELERGVKVEDVPGYKEGEFIVQDPGTKVVVDLVDAQKGETILDACAAPGGKTIQLLWRGAAVTACEVNPKRRKRLEQNLARVKLGACAGTGTRTLLSAIPSEARFNKVLVDAPCSNTGVFRRRPDARWNWSLEKLSALLKLQSEILDQAANCVAPGGSLIYATCSLEQEENEEQVHSFLTRHPEFTLEKEVRSLPFESNCDGSYAARLVRDADTPVREK